MFIGNLFGLIIFLKNKKGALKSPVKNKKTPVRGVVS